jgi:hypothetical protein
MATTQPPVNSTDASLAPQGPNLRGLIVSLIIDGAIPFILYLILTPRFPDGSVWPLVIASVAPAIGNVISIVRQRRLDYLGVIVILGLAFTVITAVVTGNQKLLLIRESFFTGGFGLVCLISLLFPRPLMFVIGRHFATGNDPARIAYFNSLWQYPGFRATQRLITVVWGIGLLGEFVIRLILIYTLSVAQVLAASPVILAIITILLVLWTLAYGRSKARQAAQRRRQPAETPVEQSEQ